jgi:hypothetical protein
MVVWHSPCESRASSAHYSQHPKPPTLKSWGFWLLYEVKKTEFKYKKAKADALAFLLELLKYEKN